ncbi:hypothetical protein H9P43_010001 [Blastocladiella emersonii ATCC 22665]|nr:hypothetical protein H9P43_010001 [Blastocladiella emersonii ATCC 22665]
MPRGASDAVNYLGKRKLASPFIGAFQLAGYVVGIVVSGEFFGWSAGLLLGWSNMVVATVLATVMYSGLVFSVCEMCCALPFASGPAAFAQVAMNSAAGAITGGVYAASYTLLAATVLQTLGTFAAIVIPGGESVPVVVYWLALSLVVLAVHWRPTRLFKLVFVLSVYCCALLVTYLALTLIITPAKQPAFAATPSLGNVPLVAPGLSLGGVTRAFPYAAWLYVGIESFPTASEEARKIFRTAPNAALYSFFIIAFFALSLLATAPETMFPDASSTPSAAAVAGFRAAQFADSNHPLFDHALYLVCTRLPNPSATFCQADPSSPHSTFLHARSPAMRIIVAVVVLPPLFLSLVAGVYAAARHVYTLSRAGVLPTRISRTGLHGSPLLATGLTCAMAMVVAAVLNAVPSRDLPTPGSVSVEAHGTDLGVPTVREVLDGSTRAAAVSAVLPVYCPNIDASTSLAILQFAVWLACTSYVLELASYIALYFRLPTLPRPFASPLGLVGACVSLTIAVMFGMVGQLVQQPVFYAVILGVMAAIVGLSIAYWHLVARARMAESPEKIFIRHQIQTLYGRRRPVLPTTSSPPSSHGGAVDPRGGVAGGPAGAFGFGFGLLPDATQPVRELGDTTTARLPPQATLLSPSLSVTVPRPHSTSPELRYHGGDQPGTALASPVHLPPSAFPPGTVLMPWSAQQLGGYTILGATGSPAPAAPNLLSPTAAAVGATPPETPTTPASLGLPLLVTTVNGYPVASPFVMFSGPDGQPPVPALDPAVLAAVAAAAAVAVGAPAPPPPPPPPAAAALVGETTAITTDSGVSDVAAQSRTSTTPP